VKNVIRKSPMKSGNTNILNVIPLFSADFRTESPNPGVKPILGYCDEYTAVHSSCIQTTRHRTYQMPGSGRHSIAERCFTLPLRASHTLGCSQQRANTVIRTKNSRHIPESTQTPNTEHSTGAIHPNPKHRAQYRGYPELPSGLVSTI